LKGGYKIEVHVTTLKNKIKSKENSNYAIEMIKD
jgi:hypothetical protein